MYPLCQFFILLLKLIIRIIKKNSKLFYFTNVIFFPSLKFLFTCVAYKLLFFFQFCKHLHENMMYLRPVEQSLRQFAENLQDDSLTILVGFSGHRLTNL